MVVFVIVKYYKLKVIWNVTFFMEYDVPSHCKHTSLSREGVNSLV